MDAITQFNDDEDDSIEELMVNLHKDRRSGQVDRRMGPSANSLARLDIDREYRSEIRALQDRENKKDLEISELKAELAKVEQWQKDQEETLTAAKVLVHAGTALKFTVMVLIGITAAIGGIAASLEALRKWVE
jgi:hypothetical protein